MNGMRKDAERNEIWPCIHILGITLYTYSVVICKCRISALRCRNLEVPRLLRNKFWKWNIFVMWHNLATCKRYKKDPKEIRWTVSSRPLDNPALSEAAVSCRCLIVMESSISSSIVLSWEEDISVFGTKLPCNNIVCGTCSKDDYGLVLGNPYPFDQYNPQHIVITCALWSW